MIDVSIDVRGVSELAEAIERGRGELRKSFRGSIVWAGANIARSMSAETRQSPKLRKVVKNSHQKAKTDGRRANYGVMRYKPDGTTYFSPIGRTGEFGKIRLINKKTGVILERDTVTGKVTRRKLETGSGEFQAPGIMQSKKRKIGRSGLAKKAWQRAAVLINRGGTADALDVKSVATVEWGGSTQSGLKLRLSNYLRYSVKALKHGEQSISIAVENAARGMIGQVERNIKAKLGAR